MEMKLNLIEFIKNNENWENLLKESPYFIKINKLENYVIFNYDIEKGSDFSLPLVRECRGIILDINTLTPVCFPFVKFFNIDEIYADKIDWESARVQEKIDGSLIKLWAQPIKMGAYLWHISTNGKINAFESNLSKDGEFNSFGDMFKSKFPFNELIRENKLNPNYTYMFEIVSPQNIIVVNYKKIDIYHLGTRDNKTGKEIEVDIGIQKPKEYNLNNEIDVKNAVKNLSLDYEGYVVVDKYYHRVKVKSPLWLKAHYLFNNNSWNEKRILSLIFENEIDEFISYFPDRYQYIELEKEKLNKYKNKIKELYKQIKLLDIKDKKEFAEWVKNNKPEFSYMCFLIYNNKVDIDNIDKEIKSWTLNKIIERINMND